MNKDNEDNFANEKRVEHDVSSYWKIREGVVTKYKVSSSIIAMGMAIHISLYSNDDWKWYSVALSIVPSLMACSAAIFIGYMCMGIGKFYDAFCSSKGYNSPFIVIMSEATTYFMSFIFTMMIAVARSSGIIDNYFFNFIGIFLMCYSITVFIAYILIFRFIIRIVHIHKNKGNIMYDEKGNRL